MSATFTRVIVSASVKISGSLLVMVEHDAEPTNEEEAFASFCLLLGRFFHAYTALEYEMSLAVYAAVLFGRPKDDVLLAVLGGQRMSALKDTLNRLMRATKATPKRQSLIKTMFQQLGEIQFFRDKLVVRPQQKNPL